VGSHFAMVHFTTNQNVLTGFSNNPKHETSRNPSGGSHPDIFLWVDKHNRADAFHL